MSAQIAVLVIQIGIILLIARLFGIVASKLKIPSVMGELLAGIIIGPYCLGGLPLPLKALSRIVAFTPLFLRSYFFMPFSFISKSNLSNNIAIAESPSFPLYALYHILCTKSSTNIHK